MVELTEQDNKFIDLLDRAGKQFDYTDYEQVSITVVEYLIKNNNLKVNPYIDPFNWTEIKRLSSYYFKLLNGIDLPKRGEVDVFKGKQLAYIIAAIRLVQD